MSPALFMHLVCFTSRTRVLTTPTSVQLSSGPVKNENPLARTSASILCSVQAVIAWEHNVAAIISSILGRVDLVESQTSNHDHSLRRESYRSTPSSIPSLFLSKSALNHELKAAACSLDRSSIRRTLSVTRRNPGSRVFSPRICRVVESFLNMISVFSGQFEGRDTCRTLYRAKVHCKNITTSPR